MIKEFDVLHNDVSQKDDAFLFQSSRLQEIIKEPYASSAFRNLLLYYPGNFFFLNS